MSFAFFSVALSACSSDNNEFPSNPKELEKEVFTCKMTLTGQRPTFGAPSTRATADGAWEDSDIIFLEFSRPNNTIASGRAIYNAESCEWTVNYDASLIRNETARVRAFYFDTPLSTTATEASLNQHVAVYEDQNATYNYPLEGILQVNADLRPRLGRIRFHGMPHTIFSVGGLKTYTKYSAKESKFWYSSTDKVDSICEDGYSAYIYGYFISSEQPQLKVKVGDNQYVADCDATDILGAGLSGWMDLPTEYAHNGWSYEDAFTPYDETLGSGSWTSTNAGQSSSESHVDLSFTAKVDDVLSFTYTVSSEQNYDKFTASLSGALSYTIVNGVSGTLTNRTVSYTFTQTGSYTLKLQYTKDGSTNTGNDRVNVTDIKLRHNS